MKIPKSKTAISTHPDRQGRLLADLSLLGIAAVWGATFFMVKDASSTFPVIAFLALRFTLASAALLPFVVQARRWPSRQELSWGLLAGLLFSGGFLFLAVSCAFAVHAPR